MEIISGTYKEMKKNSPEKIKNGTKVVCLRPGTAKLTKAKAYKVLGHHCYLNKIGKNEWTWDEFYTLKNDNGYTIKTSKRRFGILEPEID